MTRANTSSEGTPEITNIFKQMGERELGGEETPVSKAFLMVAQRLQVSDNRSSYYIANPNHVPGQCPRLAHPRQEMEELAIDELTAVFRIGRDIASIADHLFQPQPFYSFTATRQGAEGDDQRTGGHGRGGDYILIEETFTIDGNVKLLINVRITITPAKKPAGLPYHLRHDYTKTAEKGDCRNCSGDYSASYRDCKVQEEAPEDIPNSGEPQIPLTETDGGPAGRARDTERRSAWLSTRWSPSAARSPAARHPRGPSDRPASVLVADTLTEKL
ncbi:hypothetical protein J6590_025473 [Homalodisca vitripennis]|nr:hypothetical protein J6590_025473 [Homalodisca vitripennis]